MKNLKTQLMIVCCGVLFVAFASCNAYSDKRNDKKDITVFVAASLGDVLAEIRDSFMIKHPVQVHLNVASSGTLARQIAQGSAPDVYISANRRWVTYLDSLGLLSNHQSEDVARTSLVLVVPLYSKLESLQMDNSLALLDALGTGYFSMGNPAHVPVGQYAEESLRHWGLYHEVKDQLLMAHNARATLMNVEMGEANMGLVYRTDALKSSKVRVVSEVPELSHQAISYVASVLNDEQATASFYAYLQSDESECIWNKHGFK